MKLKIFNFLFEIAKICKTWSKKFQSFLIMRISFYFLECFFEKLNNKASPVDLENETKIG